MKEFVMTISGYPDSFGRIKFRKEDVLAFHETGNIEQTSVYLKYGLLFTLQCGYEQFAEWMNDEPKRRS